MSKFSYSRPKLGTQELNKDECFLEASGSSSAEDTLDWKTIHHEALMLYKTRVVKDLPEEKEPVPSRSINSRMHLFSESIDTVQRRAHCGTKDVLIFVSRVNKPTDAELDPRLVSFRKKERLSEEDKEKLREEGIPSHTWRSEAKILESRYLMEDTSYNIVGVFDDSDLTATAVLRQITDVCSSTTKFGSKESPTFYVSLVIVLICILLH